MKKFLAMAISMAMIFGVASCSSESTATTEPSASKEVIIETESQKESSTNSTETTEAAEYEINLDSLSTFEVTSENITDGVWDDIISNTSLGENLSPELSWEEVEDANLYAVYMVDTTAGYWLHLKTIDVTTNSLELGTLDSKSYIGPYPPSGTHDYVIYVFALRENPESIKGAFDSSNVSLAKMFTPLDINESGDTGNVISYGMLFGTFTSVSER